MEKLDIYTKRSTQIAFKTTPAIRESLENAATYQGTTLSSLTEYIVKDWLKKQTEEREII